MITDPDYINQTIVWMVRQRNKGIYKGDEKDVRRVKYENRYLLHSRPLKISSLSKICSWCASIHFEIFGKCF